MNSYVGFAENCAEMITKETNAYVSKHANEYGPFFKNPKI